MESIQRGILDSFFTFSFQIMHLTFCLILFCPTSSSISKRCWVYWMKIVGRDFWKGIFIISTFHDIVVLQIFGILQVDFVPTCAQVQSFDSQPSGNMDVHEFQYAVETTFTSVHSIQCFFCNLSYCSFLICYHELFPIKLNSIMILFT
jgi:hypothetical protein